jgi:hypothetical protein
MTRGARLKAYVTTWPRVATEFLSEKKPIDWKNDLRDSERNESPVIDQIGGNESSAITPRKSSAPPLL